MRTAPRYPTVVTRRHQEIPTCLSWSPDGRRLASAGQAGLAQVWDPSTGTPLLTYVGHQPVSITSLTWSPDGARIASVGHDQRLQVWDATTGASLFFYPLGDTTGTLLNFSAVIWSPDGATLATSFQHQLRLWDAEMGTLLQACTQPSLVLCLAWSPDGTRLLIGALDGSLSVAESATGRLLYTLHGCSNAVRAVAWSPTGEQIAAGQYHECLVGDVASSTLVTAYQHAGPVHALAWSPDGTQIASAGADQGVHLWNARSGQMQAVYIGHREAVTAVAWSPNGTRLASASRDRTVQIWSPLEALPSSGSPYAAPGAFLFARLGATRRPLTLAAERET